MNTYYITAYWNGTHYRQWKYLDYTKREAIKLYRERFGLVGKHATINVSTSY